MTHHNPPRSAYNHHATYTDGKQAPKVIVLHSTESDGTGAHYIKSIFDYLDREHLSVHALVAKDGAIGYAATGDTKCRHAPPNTGKIGIEQAGYADFTKYEWMNRGHQLHQVAKLVAWYSYYWDIPIKHSTTHGVCMHVDLPEGGHHDPGKGYPFAYVLDMAKVYRSHLYAGKRAA